MNTIFMTEIFISCKFKFLTKKKSNDLNVTLKKNKIKLTNYRHLEVKF